MVSLGVRVMVRTMFRVEVRVMVRMLCWEVCMLTRTKQIVFIVVSER